MAAAGAIHCRHLRTSCSHSSTPDIYTTLPPTYQFSVRVTWADALPSTASPSWPATTAATLPQNDATILLLRAHFGGSVDCHAVRHPWFAAPTHHLWTAYGLTQHTGVCNGPRATGYLTIFKHLPRYAAGRENCPFCALPLPLLRTLHRFPYSATPGLNDCFAGLLSPEQRIVAHGLHG